jgi:hypothetical protein
MTYECPCCHKKFQYEGVGVVECPLCAKKVRVGAIPGDGVAWDGARSGDHINAFFSTIKRSMFDTLAFFRDVANSGEWIMPSIYALIIAMFVFFVVAAYQTGFNMLVMSSEYANSGVMPPALQMQLAALPLWMMIAGAAITVPIATAIMLLVQSCLYHLCLMLVGGARGSFVTTFRVTCYCAGPQVLQLVPFIGGFIATGWQMGLAVIGLKQAHGTSYGKSALAVFLPMLFCCGLVFLLFMVIMGAAFAGAVGSAAS